VEESGVANGIRFSRCEVSAASEAVSWKRWLGALVLGISPH